MFYLFQQVSSGESLTISSGSMEFSWLEYFTVIGTFTVVFFGLFGNAMTAAVLTRKRFRSRNVSIYLLALAVVDSLFLVSNTMVSYSIKLLGGTDIQGLSDFGCRLAKYVLMSSRAMSAWFVVVLTVQRLLAMSIPHLAQVLSTRRRAYISTAVIIFIVLGLYSYLFFVLEVREGTRVCHWKGGFQRISTLLNIIDLLFYSLIPAVILATCNSILIYMLFYSEELRKEATKNSRCCGSGAESRSVTVVLVLMSVSFIILTLPMTFHQVIHTVGFRPPIPYALLYILNLINHAANFLLYCVSGPTFRSEIRDMFCSRRMRKNSSSRNTYKCRHRRSGDTQSTQETRVNGLNTPPVMPNKNFGYNAAPKLLKA